MTRISELVRKVDTGTWLIIGLMVTGWIVVALVRFINLTVIPAVVILIIAFILAWVGRQKAVWGRYSQSTPIRAKMPWVIFQLVGLLGAIVVAVVATISHVNQQPFYITIATVLVGCIIWFGIGFIIISIGLVPIVPRKKEK